MVGQERAPGLGGRGAPLGDESGDGALAKPRPTRSGASEIRGPRIRAWLEVEWWATGILYGLDEGRRAGRLRAAFSALTGGRSSRGEPESVVQCSRKRR